MSRMQDKNTPNSPAVFVGIDVGKAALDICLLPMNESIQVPNTAAGIRKLIERLKSVHVQRVAIEATGRYHRRAHRMLHHCGIPVAVINPYRSRKFADALGKLAKSDKIDASVLAQFAAVMSPEPTLPSSQQQQALCDLNVARRQVLQEVGDLQRQLSETTHALIARQIRARIKIAKRHLKTIQQEIRDLIRSNEMLHRRFAILTSFLGIGFVTAITMLTDFEELGQANCKQIAALAGVAPMNQDSGAMRGTRVIRGGRPHIRNALYMGAVSQTYRDSPPGVFYRRLVRDGKNPKVALTAVMRKLVIIANTLISENRAWQPTPP